MLFTEPTFLFLFLPIVLALYFAPLSRVHGRYGNWLLLLASLAFYAKGGGSFTWLMLASIAFNYWIAIAIAGLKPSATTVGKAATATRESQAEGSSVAQPFRAARTARWLLAFAVGANLLVLGVFKYSNFAADNLNSLLVTLQVNPVVIPRVLLPIGISFFTFHAISYVVDVYRGDAVAQKSPVHAALYMLLFPQLIAGPIIRYRNIADQLAARQVSLDDFAYGVRRFVIGLAKKVLIANVVAGPADQIFGLAPGSMTPSAAWLGIICYTLQIYFDFSGYSDMALGLGRMFGFRFPENFRWPYVAETVQDFWRRWHISLSAWFRDYLYVPLGGNRTSAARTYCNLVIVFFLCGLWHGASWNFVVWGLFHGSFLVLERLGLGEAIEHLWKPIRHAYLLVVVMIGWIFFRAESLPAAVEFLRALAGREAVTPTPYALQWYLTPELWLALVAGAIGSMPIVPALAKWRDGWSGLDAGRDFAPRLSAIGATALVLLLVASIMQIAARSYNPFIYFRF